MNAISRPPLSQALRSSGARVALAMMLALGTSYTLIRSSSLEPRVDSNRSAQEQIQRTVLSFGTHTFGEVFLQGGSTADESISPSTKKLMEIGDELNPDSACGVNGQNCKTGALYDLREFLRDMAMFFIIPFSLITLFHLIVTTGGSLAGDKKLAMIVVNMLLAVCAIQWYPYWDHVIFNGVTRPMVNFLGDKDLINSMMNKAMIPKDAEAKMSSGAMLAAANSLGPGSTDVAPDFGRDQVKKVTLGDKCIRLIGQGDYTCMKDEADLRPEVAIGAANWVVTMTPNSELDKLAQMIRDNADPVTRAAFSRVPSMSKRGLSLVGGAVGPSQVSGGPQKVPEWVSGLADKVISGIGDFLNKHIIGWIIWLQNMLTVAIMWFVWLGVILARALSLTLAPIAFAWFLLPKQSEHLSKWFTGHAKIVLQPVGFSIGLLVINVASAAILDSGGLGDGVVGLGVRLAFFVVLMMSLLRMKDLTSEMGKGVAEVAAGFGSRVRDGATNMAVGAGKAAAIAGTGGAALAAGGAAGMLSNIPGVKGTFDAMSRFRKEGVMGTLANKAEAAGAPSAVSKSLRFGQAAVNETKAAAGSVVKGGFGAVVPDAAKGTFQAAKSRGEEKFSEGYKILGLKPEQYAKLDTAAMSEARDAVLKMRATNNGQPLTERAGEPPVPAQPAFPVAFNGSKSQQKVANDLTSILKSEGVDTFLPNQVDANGNLMPMSRDTSDALSKLYLSNVAFRQKMDLALAGLDLPTAKFNGKDVPDFATAMHASTAFGHSMLEMASLTAGKQDALREREQRSLLVESQGAEKNSATDLAIRAFDPKTTSEQFDGLEEGEKGAKAMQMSQKALRVAYAMDPQGKEQVIKAIQAGQITSISEDDVRDGKNLGRLMQEKAIDVMIPAEWSSGAHIKSLDPAQQAQFGANIQLAVQAVETALENPEGAVYENGVPVSIDMQAYKQSLGEKIVYTGAEGSAYRTQMDALESMEPLELQIRMGTVFGLRKDQVPQPDDPRYEEMVKALAERFVRQEIEEKHKARLENMPADARELFIAEHMFKANP